VLSFYIALINSAQGMYVVFAQQAIQHLFTDQLIQTLESNSP